MIYELRIYTCQPGGVQKVLELWKNQGQAMIEPYMKMVGQWTAETGIVNQIYTLWEYEDMNHRQKARGDLMKHPGMPDYLAACRQYYVQQEAIFLSPTDISPMK